MPSRVPAGSVVAVAPAGSAFAARRDVVQHPVHPGHLRCARIGRVGIIDDQREALGASAGASDQASGGDASPPSQVCFAGIWPPWAKAVDVSLSVMAETSFD